jgi:hypothetical protein
MVKLHNVHLVIQNDSGVEMHSPSTWFDSGRLADSYEWPSNIPNGHNLDVLLYEKDWAVTGCSGTVTYTINNTPVTFGFSNPLSGTNKLGVGKDSRKVWDGMQNHNYDPFDVQLRLGDVDVTFQCRCSGGTTNVATVKIVKCERVHQHPAKSKLQQPSQPWKNLRRVARLDIKIGLENHD